MAMDYMSTAGPQMPSNGWYGNQPQVTGAGPQMYGQRPMMPMEQRGISTVTTVSNREGAENYPVAAGQTALIVCFESPEKGLFWLKTTDIYGRSIPMLEFTFNQRIQNNGQTADSSMVSKKDFDDLTAKFDALYKELHG